MSRVEPLFGTYKAHALLSPSLKYQGARQHGSSGGGLNVMCCYNLQKLKSTLGPVGRVFTVWDGIHESGIKSSPDRIFFGKRTLALLLGIQWHRHGWNELSTKSHFKIFWLSFHQKMLNFFVWPGIQVKEQYKFEVAVCRILCFFVEAKPQNKIQSSTQM